jgi:D-apionolactonase
MSCYSAKSPFTHHNKQVMTDAECYTLYYGTDEPPLLPTLLRAGALSLQFEQGSLRYLRVGESEIIHQIYAAVRDGNWGTIAGVLSDLQTNIREDAFDIRFTSTHQAGDIHFVWRGHIIGNSDSSVTFHFDGEALSTFARNRIGFCVLHPLAAAGAKCEIEQVDGAVISGSFPRYIEPHQPYKNLRVIQHEYAPSAWAEVRMEGDTFEMEDQRNWSDASFKTYCTPLELPFPVTIERGTRIRQTVTVRLLQPPATPIIRVESPPILRYEPRQSLALPVLGVGAASHGEPLTAHEIERLRALRLAHLRVDIEPSAPDSAAALQRTADEAAALGAGVEIALHLGDDAAAELAQVKAWVGELSVPIRRWLIFKQGEKSTRGRWLHLARQVFDDGVAIGAGTNAFFTELNRERPDDLSAFDFVTYSSNPQVHAFDNASLVETNATLAIIADTARQFCADKPLVLSPLTLKMRANPNATSAEVAPLDGELPRAVDPRQMSLFGGGYTLGALKYLLASGIAAVTLYETTGWLGVMEREGGAPLPQQFPSVAGGVFPLYHVLADVGEFSGGAVLSDFTSSKPLAVEGIALRQGERLRLMLANTTPHPQTIAIHGFANSFNLRTLDETNFDSATRDPQSYRAQSPTPLTAQDGRFELTLLPYALATLDGKE